MFINKEKKGVMENNMIKLKMRRNGKDVIGLGLSDGNIDLLRNDQPIIIDGSQMDLPHDILIFWGKTEKDMYERFKNEGLLTKDTKLNISPDIDG